MSLSADRNTLAKSQGLTACFKVKAATTIYKGALVALDSSGWAVPAGATAGHRVIGRAEETVDNSDGDSGDLSIAVRQGVYRWTNSAGAAVAQAHIGSVVYVEADSIVASSASNSIVAGIATEIDGDYVWVATFYGLNGAALQGYPSSGTVETVATGAVNPALALTTITIDGTKAYTLADGTIEGQRKNIRVKTAANTPDGTLTPATFADGTSIDLDAVNESVELEWHATGGWRVVHIVGATITA